MPFFHALRSSPWLSRLTLLWFALTLAAAVAAPVIHPQSELVICSGLGMQRVLIDGDGTVTSSAVAGISCPLCLMGGAPAPTTVPIVAPVQALGPVVPCAQTAHIARFHATPPPARGPPRL